MGVDTMMECCVVGGEQVMMSPAKMRSLQVSSFYTASALLSAQRQSHVIYTIQYTVRFNHPSFPRHPPPVSPPPRTPQSRSPVPCGPASPAGICPGSTDL